MDWNKTGINVSFNSARENKPPPVASLYAKLTKLQSAGSIFSSNSQQESKYLYLSNSLSIPSRGSGKKEHF